MPVLARWLAGMARAVRSLHALGRLTSQLNSSNIAHKVLLIFGLLMVVLSMVMSLFAVGLLLSAVTKFAYANAALTFVFGVVFLILLRRPPPPPPPVTTTDTDKMEPLLGAGGTITATGTGGVSISTGYAAAGADIAMYTPPASRNTYIVTAEPQPIQGVYRFGGELRSV